MIIFKFLSLLHAIWSSAPTDGRDMSTNNSEQSIFLTSKQNSDASGMFYQWGRKDPFTFPTNSEAWGLSNERGKYAVKIYTIDGVLIYQESNGSNNTDKQPAGGVILTSKLATSMMEAIKKPITFYGMNSAVISQVEYTRSLWDYYWTSHSRGTDGKGAWNSISFPNFHNNYLEDYTSPRSKSIYDPCPFGFRLPSNGTYNDFKMLIGWSHASYTGGSTYTINTKLTWTTSIYRRSPYFFQVGHYQGLQSSTISSVTGNYIFMMSSGIQTWPNYLAAETTGHSVRCIEKQSFYCNI